MATTAPELTDLDRDRMRSFFNTLSEKDARRFAAVEASTGGHGGITLIAEILGLSTRTIQRGIAELDHLDTDPAAGRVRRPGGGRKKKLPPKRRSKKT